MQLPIRMQEVSDVPEAAKKILSWFAVNRIFAISGEMGAGKTTLIAEICRQLGVQDHTSSPTFAIVNEYAGKGKIFHIDLFRVRSLQEALYAGIEEYLSGINYCFIEWPELIQSLLPPMTIRLKIELRGENERMISLIETSSGQQITDNQ